MPKSGNMPKNERVKRPLGHSIRERLKRISEHNLLLIMSFVVGVLSGLAAVILKKLVEWIQEGQIGRAHV